MRTATAGESLASSNDGDAAATAAETSASPRGVLAATAATAHAGARGISSWLTGSGVGVTERADDPPELEPSFDVPRGVLLNHDREPRRPEAEPSFEPRRPSGGTRGSEEEEGTSLSSAAYLPAAPFFFRRERARADHELARLRGGCDPAASRAASSAASFAAAFAAADGTSLLRSLSNEPLRLSGSGGGGVGAAARCASYDVDDDAATARSSVRKEKGTRPRWPSAVRAMHHPEVPPPSMIWRRVPPPPTSLLLLGDEIMHRHVPPARHRPGGVGRRRRRFAQQCRRRLRRRRAAAVGEADEAQRHEAAGAAAVADDAPAGARRLRAFQAARAACPSP